MNKLSVCLVFSSFSLFAGGDIVPSTLGEGKRVSTLSLMQEKKIDCLDESALNDCDCKKAMRLCGLFCGATSVSGCGMYVGGALADSGLVSTLAVVNLGAGVMCCGLLGALIGASCPPDEEQSEGATTSCEKAPVAKSMEYGTLPRVVLLEDLSQTK